MKTSEAAVGHGKEDTGTAGHTRGPFGLLTITSIATAAMSSSAVDGNNSRSGRRPKRLAQSGELYGAGSTRASRVVVGALADHASTFQYCIGRLTPAVALSARIGDFREPLTNPGGANKKAGLSPGLCV
jgi:hypothetical protein